MLNMLFALGCGLVVALGLALPRLLHVGEAAVPAVLVALVAYVILARRSFRQLERILAEGAAVLQQNPPRFEQAIGILQRGYALAPRQVGIRSQVDAQIGVICFLQKDFSRALPNLQRSLMFGHWLGGAMLAVVYYKKKDIAQMRKTLAIVSRRAKGQGLIWQLYAYLLLQVGDRAGALKALVEGTKHARDDARVRESLLALQNGKKLKMRAYREQWYQFHLERPPAEVMQQGGGRMGRMGRVARRGRW